MSVGTNCLPDHLYAQNHRDLGLSAERRASELVITFCPSFAKVNELNQSKIWTNHQFMSPPNQAYRVNARQKQASLSSILVTDPDMLCALPCCWPSASSGPVLCREVFDMVPMQVACLSSPMPHSGWLHHAEPMSLLMLLYNIPTAF